MIGRLICQRYSHVNAFYYIILNYTILTIFFLTTRSRRLGILHNDLLFLWRELDTLTPRRLKNTASHRLIEFAFRALLFALFLYWLVPLFLRRRMFQIFLAIRSLFRVRLFAFPASFLRLWSRLISLLVTLLPRYTTAATKTRSIATPPFLPLGLIDLRKVLSMNLRFSCLHI